MRLLRDVGDNCRNPIVWPLEMSDDRIKSRICALGEMLEGTPSEKTLQHIVKVVKLLHRFHYPVTAPADRDIGVFNAKELKWLWQWTDTLTHVFPFKISTLPRVQDYDTLLAKLERFPKEICNCLMSCWDEIVTLQLGTEMESALLIDAALNDKVLLLVLRHSATNHDLWSYMNIQAKDSVENVLWFYLRIGPGGQKVLRLFSRIISRGVIDYKRALEMDATTDEQRNVRDAKIAGTKPVMETSLMEPFAKAFFTGLDVGVRINRLLFYQATYTPKSYENIVWWMVAMLCREDWSFWGDNIKPHLRDLINTWDGGSPTIPSDVALVTRLEAVVAYIVQHSQQENRLVTGNNDKQEALWTFTESAAPRYRPIVQDDDAVVS